MKTRSLLALFVSILTINTTFNSRLPIPRDQQEAVPGTSFAIGVGKGFNFFVEQLLEWEKNLILEFTQQQRVNQKDENNNIPLAHS